MGVAAHETTTPGGRRWRWLLLLALASALAYPITELAPAALRRQEQRALLRMLRSPQPILRKQGAWLTLEHQKGQAIEYIARQLAARAEENPDVRECYVYALGYSGQRQYFGVVAEILLSDDSGYVRQAAWLALARLDPKQFMTLDQARPPSDDLWDQIGRSIARLEVGDVRDIPKLLRWAQTASPDQRLVVCAALYRSVRPLVEAAGRWPLGMDVAEGQLWPPALLEEVGRRCAKLDLQRLAEDTRPHLAGAALVRRNAYRMTSARNWIAWLLSRF